MPKNLNNHPTDDYTLEPIFIVWRDNNQTEIVVELNSHILRDETLSMIFKDVDKAMTLMVEDGTAEIVPQLHIVK